MFTIQIQIIHNVKQATYLRLNIIQIYVKCVTHRHNIIKYNIIYGLYISSEFLSCFPVV